MVLGGGLAGLSAAARLATAGAAVTVVEAESHVGGRLATPESTSFSDGGTAWDFPIEHGLHGVWEGYRNMRGLLGELGLLDRLRRARSQELVAFPRSGPPIRVEIGRPLRESPLPAPLHLAALLGQPALRREMVAHSRAWIRAGLDAQHTLAFVAERDGPAFDQLTVADLISGWPPTLRHLATALSHSAFFRAPEQASLATFLEGLQQYVVFGKAANAFDVFDDSTGATILPALVDVIEASGGRVLTGHRATELMISGRLVQQVRIDGPDGEVTLSADGVVASLDPPGWRQLVTRSGLADLWPADAIPSATDSVVVRIWYRAPPEGDYADTGIVSGGGLDAFFWLHRLQRPFERWHASTGGGVVEAHVYASRAVGARQLSDEELVDQVASDLEVAWPELRRAGRRHAHVRRNPPTHTCLMPGAADRLSTVSTTLPNLALAGDWVRAPDAGFFMERAVTTGLLAARRVAPFISGRLLDELPCPIPVPGPPRTVRALRVVTRGARHAGLLTRLT